MKINQISPDEHVFTKVLAHIPKPPKTLYYIGNLPQKRLPTLAIVGTRRPSTYGVEVTSRFAYEIAKKGVVIVSGLALGVDAIAHKAAMEAKGVTMAILPCGLPKIAPATNRNIAENMVKSGGALLSEYSSEVVASWKSNMLERNRLVSGLADGLLITEASARSGTLNTARHALEQGKEVFVIPGNITSPLSAGCNALIKQGALPVTEFADILNVIAPDLVTPQAVLALGDTPLESDIIALLNSGVRDGEALQVSLAVTTAELNGALTMLELNGAIRGLGANQWTLR